MKRFKRIILILLGLIMILCLITAVMLFVPRVRTFNYFHLRSNTYNEDIMMFDDHVYPYQYSGRASKHFCYVDSDSKLPDLTDDETIDLYTRPIGIRLYRTDNSGIWMSFPVIVFKYEER
ncbi:MAG: hypothetical protein J5525_14170 [Lachnospiraceae bacterium]|nr:hypothetical protein [Lachnospiraceae bacterium]